METERTWVFYSEMQFLLIENLYRYIVLCSAITMRESEAEIGIFAECNIRSRLEADRNKKGPNPAYYRTLQ